MDARVKPGHDSTYLVCSLPFQPNSFSANASLSRGFDFGPRAGPWSLFSFFPKQGEWSAGRRREVCETSLGPALRSAGLRAELPGPNLGGGPSALREWGSRGARARAKGPAPPGAPFAARIVGGRTLLRHPVSRSTTPSIEQGMADIGQDARIAKFNSRVCKVLQHCGEMHQAKAAESALR